MLTRTQWPAAQLVAALALGCTATAARAADVLVDRATVPLDASVVLPEPLALHVEVDPPRWPTDAITLPAAWRVQGEGAGARAVLDPALSLQLAEERDALALRSALERRLRDAASAAGHELAPITTETAALVLEREELPGAAIASVAAQTRLLMRGNVRDRWRVPEAVQDPEPLVEPAPDGDGAVVEPAPPSTDRPDAPDIVLHVVLVSAGVHLEGSSYPLPANLAYLSLQTRLWDVRAGVRLWDRTLMVGLEVPEAGPRAFAAAAAHLLEHAAAATVAGPWPDTAPELPEAVPAVLLAAPEPEDVGELLARLAATRLEGAPEGEPWRLLGAAVRGRVSPALRTLLALAEDPTGSAARTGARRMGLSLAEAHARLRTSDALRASVARDLVDQVTIAEGSTWELQKAANALVAELEGKTLLPRQAADAARPLLEAARAENAYTAESIAKLLVAVKLAPDESAGTLRQVL